MANSNKVPKKQKPESIKTYVALCSSGVPSTPFTHFIEGDFSPPNHWYKE